MRADRATRWRDRQAGRERARRAAIGDRVISSLEAAVQGLRDLTAFRAACERRDLVLRLVPCPCAGCLRSRLTGGRL